VRHKFINTIIIIIINIIIIIILLLLLGTNTLDSVQYRNLVIQNGALDILLEVAQCSTTKLYKFGDCDCC
jgi:hypothetical protein